MCKFKGTVLTVCAHSSIMISSPDFRSLTSQQKHLVESGRASFWNSGIGISLLRLFYFLFLFNLFECWDKAHKRSYGGYNIYCLFLVVEFTFTNKKMYLVS